MFLFKNLDIMSQADEREAALLVYARRWEKIMGKRITPLMRITALLFAAAIALTTVGCSGNVAEDENIQPDSDVPSFANQDQDVEQIVNPDRSLFEGETLTIAESLFAENLKPLAQSYMTENPGVTIEIIDYFDEIVSDGNWLNVQQEIATQLMAGSAPVLISGRLVDHIDPRSAVFCADWHPIMAADPEFDEDDWFMNVFHAASVGGRLYAFPMAFVYETVEANSEIPGLLNAFEDKDGITITELLTLHREIPTDEPYHFDYSTNVNRVVMQHLGSFIDFETGWADFNNDELMELITYARDITDENGSQWRNTGYSLDTQRILSELYFFMFSTPMNYDFYIDYEEKNPFSGLLPLVNEQGELLISPTNEYVLNANATPTQQALAWDFMRYMMKSDRRDEWSQLLMQPTNRTRLRVSVEWDAAEHQGWSKDNAFHARRDQLIGTPEEAAESVIAKMTSFGDMPMRLRSNLPYVLIESDGVITLALEQFQDGLVSAEQTAQDLQNRVELVLMEMGLW